MLSRAPVVLLVLLGSALADVPTEAQKKWLLENAVQLRTVEAGNGFEDLEPLKAMIGDARIVGLGESTHGTREHFQMKYRLVEFLVKEMGFSIFSIEACMPESFRVSDYAVHGKGNPNALIRGMYFWTWSTEEVRAMVDWMREYNTPGKERVKFTGFDMQTPDVAARIVLDFLREVDPERAAEATKTYETKVLHASRQRRASFGSTGGNLSVEAVAGRKVRFRGFIKTEDVKGWAGLWFRADKDRKPVAFDNMARRAPRGTTPWKEYVIELEIPEEITNFVFGTLLSGSGKAWFDGLQLEIDGKAYRREGMDLDFEGAEFKGLWVPRGGDYRGTLDKEVVHTGEQSMRLERLTPMEPDGTSLRAAAAGKVLEAMEAAREAYLERAPAKEVDWAIQNARVVLQCMQSRAGQVHRDVSMARNVEWITRQNPRAKIVLWAHNWHVSRSPMAMGHHLTKTFGKDYVAIGFATKEGLYTAVVRGKGLRSDNVLQAPPPGSVESLLAAIGKPILLLDLRKAVAGSPESGWLTEMRPFRSIGALAMEKQFHPQQVPTLYDLLVYVEKTTATVQLPR